MLFEHEELFCSCRHKLNSFFIVPIRVFSPKTKNHHVSANSILMFTLSLIASITTLLCCSSFSLARGRICLLKHQGYPLILDLRFLVLSLREDLRFVVFIEGDVKFFHYVYDFFSI